MKVTILCSGFGLGFYTPGLLLEAGFRRQGLDTAVHVFENVLPVSARIKMEENQTAYHDNFAVALMSQKIPQDMRTLIDPAAMEELISLWLREDRRHFICLSGHWIYVLEEYRSRRKPGTVRTDIIYMDSTPSPSWKNLAKHNPGFAEGSQESTLFDFHRSRINQYINIPDIEQVPYNERESRLLIHGGGWGMGTYRDKISELEAVGWDLDILLYNQDEVPDHVHQERYFRMDPQWRTWLSYEGKHVFPPFGEVKQGQETAYDNHSEYHLLLERTRLVKAIVSKPGGGSMTDSFATATPLIMLEPFGGHEKNNADLWEHMGFGIRYDVWVQEHGGSQDVLASMHEAIVDVRERTPRYMETLAGQYEVDRKIREEYEASQASPVSATREER